MSGIGKVNLTALDSNIFIYQFESNPDFILLTKRIFNDLDNNKFKAVTSVISTIEALSYPSPPEVIKDITEAFLTLRNLEIIEVSQDVAFEAARIRRKYGFRLPDSIQLATAKLSKAKEFMTNDERLRRFKELKVVLLKEI